MLFLFITSKTNWLADNEIKNVHMKFEIDEILKWIEAMLLKPSTEGRTDKVNPVYPPTNFLRWGWGYNKAWQNCAYT